MPQNDPNNYSWLVTPLVAFMLAVSGWYMKVIWGRTNDNAKSAQKVSDNLGRHKLHLAENYVPKGDFKHLIDRMEKRFDKIEELCRRDK